MTNEEKQADEILVLQSIFDKNFRFLDHNQYDVLIQFEFPTPILLIFNNQTSKIQYLPPFTLIIHNHNEYPTIEPPSFILSCFYFSKANLEQLCQKLDDYSFNNEVCVYDWINIIKQQINNQLIISHNETHSYINDPRALNGYTNQNLEQIYQYLITYDFEYEYKEFKKQFHICFICTDMIPGNNCIRLSRCKHVYCRSCLKNYIEINLNNGLFGDKLYCPDNQCKELLIPTEVKELLESAELYERYERLTLEHSLQSMNDIVWCPRY